MSKPAAPRGLAAVGAKLWREVVATYDLRVDELTVLEAACRASDRSALMRDELDALPLMVTGSTGQQVVNPLVAEIRAHEAQVASLLARLKLPDDPVDAADSPRSAQARAAAQSRWSTAHGKGA
jgi:hypothetical protein